MRRSLSSPSLVQSVLYSRMSKLLSAGVMTATLVLGTATAAPLGADVLQSPGLPTQTPNEDVSRAVELFQKRDFVGAINALKAAKQEDDSLPPAQIMFARLCFSAQQFKAAQLALEEAVTEQPDHPEAYLMLGELGFRDQRITECGLLFDHAGKLAAALPEDDPRKQEMLIRATAGRAAVAESREQWDQAHDHLLAWLELDPESKPAMHRLGLALFGQGKPEAAFEQLKKAAEADASFSEPSVTLARLYEKQGNREKANEWMKFAANKASQSARTQREVAQWLWETEQTAEAEQRAAAALQLEPELVENKLLLGLIKLHLAKYSEAEQLLESAHIQAPGNFAASNLLIMALADQKQEKPLKRALELAQANTRQLTDINDPRFTDAWATLGYVNFQLGNHRVAEENLRTAASRRQLTSDMAYYMALVANAQGRANEAIPLLERALAATGPFAHRTQATALLKSLAQAQPAAAPPAN